MTGIRYLHFQRREVVLLQRAANFPAETRQIGAIGAAGLLGRLLGALIFGGLVDRHGRKTLYRLYPLIIATFGATSALSPNALWLILLQVFVGMGVVNQPLHT